MSFKTYNLGQINKFILLFKKSLVCIHNAF